MRITGCFKYSKTYNFTYQFAEGSVVYLCAKASKGVLENIAIKFVRIVPTRGTSVIMYVDTYNALYAEEELCTQAEAVAAAVLYYQMKVANLDAKIASLSCP